MSRRLILVLSLFVLLSFLPYLVEPDLDDVKATNGYPVHNLDTGLDYTTIQEAIDATETKDGHTIFVEEGTYYEKVIIDKSLSLIGENRNTTILDGQTQHWPVAINHTSHVTFRGFSVLNSYGHYGYGGGGVYLEWSDSCIITDNILNNNQYGIALYGGSSNNVVYDNLLIENAANILVLSHFPHKFARNNTFFNNTLTGAPYGPAFELGSMTECTIISNTIANNRWGIMISEPYAMYPPNNHTIYRNNFINNTFQVRINQADPTVYRSEILWDNGYEGNYWSDYNGTDFYKGPYQNLTGSDGIGDTPYVIDENNTDRYPLMGFPCFMVGDITGPDGYPDGKVDMRDVGLVARHFGQTVPPAPAKCDITGPITGVPDGTINMRDVGLVARYFGQDVPPAPVNCDLTGPITGVPDGTINMRDVGLVARHFGETDP